MHLIGKLLLSLLTDRTVYMNDKDTDNSDNRISIANIKITCQAHRQLTNNMRRFFFRV